MRPLRTFLHDHISIQLSQIENDGDFFFRILITTFAVHIKFYFSSVAVQINIFSQQTVNSNCIMMCATKYQVPAYNILYVSLQSPSIYTLAHTTRTWIWNTSTIYAMIDVHFDSNAIKYGSFFYDFMYLICYFDVDDCCCPHCKIWWTDERMNVCIVCEWANFSHSNVHGVMNPTARKCHTHEHITRPHYNG